MATIQRCPAPPLTRPRIPVSPLPSVIQQSSERPIFNTNSKNNAFLTYNLRNRGKRLNLRKPGLPDINGTMPHRMSWKAIRDNVAKFCNGTDDDDDFTRWTDRFIEAGDEKITITRRFIRKNDQALTDLKDWLKTQIFSQKAFEQERDQLLQSGKSSKRKDFEDRAYQFHATDIPGPYGDRKDVDFRSWTRRFIDAGLEEIALTRESIKKNEQDQSDLKGVLKAQTVSQKAFEETRDSLLSKSDSSSRRGAFEKEANQFHANVPDVGPHLGVNNPVQDHPHLNVRRSRSRTQSTSSKKRQRERSLSPMSKRVRLMSPERLSEYPVNSEGDLITTTGETVPFSRLDKTTRKHIEEVGTKTIKGYDEDFEWDFKPNFKWE
jgi:hypothetical protein